MEISKQLQETELFEHVDPDTLAALAANMHHRVFSQGDVLFRVGEMGDAMYIILSGQVRIFTVNQGHELTLMHYGPTEIFGEFTLLDNKPRSASAAAATPLEVMVLHRKDFMDFLTARPQVSLAMMRSLSRRARYTTAYVEEIVQWARRLASGEYKQAIDEISQASSDDRKLNEIPGLIAAFLQMARNVQEREDKLKQEIVRMRVKVDQEERITAVHEITSTDFFSSLKQQARKMRAETTGEIPTDLADLADADEKSPLPDESED
jgi:CRP-like cAMP-binding protein